MKDHASFIFHKSYADVLWRLPAEQKSGFVEMLTRYAFTQAMPSEDDPNYNYFLLIRPIMDKSQERAESGAKGGRASRHSGASLQASLKSKRSDRDDDKDNDKDREKEIEESFSTFWKVYPRKDGKKAAQKSFVRIMRDADDPADLLDRLIRSVELARRSPQWQRDDGQFIPLPATWLNNERWEDQGVEDIPGELTGDECDQSMNDIAAELLREGETA